MVLMLHLAVQLGDGSFGSDLLLVPALGVGVDLFFVISGVVVVHSLSSLATRSGNKWSAASHFFVRRFARIVPTAWFVAAVAALMTIVPGTVATGDVTAAATFSANVYWAPCFAGSSGCGDPQLLGHYWSVAAEVQFYLIAPLLVLASRRNLWIAVAVVWSIGAFTDRPWGGFLWTFRLDALLLGIALGVELRNRSVRRQNIWR